MKKCVIVAGGDCNAADIPADGCFVIAADSGFDYCKVAGIFPNLIVGDFDSVKSSLSSGTETIKLPVKKDDTDLLYAVRCGIDRGFDEITIYGGYGSRPDMNIAMLQTMYFAVTKGKKCVAECNGFTATMIHNSALTLLGSKRKFSVFAFGGTAEGVSIYGAEYPLDNKVLDVSFPIGTSNLISGLDATVSVKKGTVLIIAEKCPYK